MKGQWIGPMPIADFFTQFLPVPDSVKESSPSRTLGDSYFNSVPNGKKEVDMYDPFVKLVNEKCTSTGKSRILPGFQLVNNSAQADRNSKMSKKIHCDVTAYEEHVDVSGKGNATKYEHTEMQFEFKVDKNCIDPFDDPAEGLTLTREQLDEHKFEPIAEGRVLCRGQMASYVTEWCNRQHRVHAFTVYIGQKSARFIRFDRAGAIVSRAFLYRERSGLLIDFLWRFAHLSRSERGYDTTVREADDAERALAYEHLAEWKPDQERPILVFTVPAEVTEPADGRDREVIAWGAMGNADSPTGRATRAYPVYDMTMKKVVFMKDTWRSSKLEKETAILKELNEKKVRNVPKLLVGEDIPNQITRTDQFIASTWRAGKVSVTRRLHNRFLEDFVGRHLKKFKSSKELMQAIYDALLAHQDAYELCHILHRDISDRNVLLDGEGGGVLNDWDMAKRVTEDKKPRAYGRTGTWLFMSTLMLQKPGKQHVLQDDLESFVQLVIYHGLLYLKHNVVPELPDIIEEVFDDHKVNVHGESIGGKGKDALFMRRKYITKDFEFENNKLLTEWLRFAILAVKEWITAVTYTPEPTTNPFIKSASLSSPVKKPDPESLVFHTHKPLLNALEILISTNNWPEDDAVAIQWKPPVSKGSSRSGSTKRSISSVETNLDSGRKSKRSKTAKNSMLRHSSGAAHSIPEDEEEVQ
ncbi:hypothetical protein BDQ12DRAFT_650578 [Crucibulum laeve]|uniref:Protein kinase domain-containing protein n=1 Tax=Crucibulum laeve TaxID=68775 RepID=A0A5C3MCS2_9AGAR|nr:hypothetical protein BDQ12DRAFT_650578 [Crucibulum laeve]